MPTLQPTPLGRSETIDQIDAALPQTQCRRCGEPDCLSYARAIVDGTAINRCPPGGAQGVLRLAELTGRPVIPLDPTCGEEAARSLAWIDESACIGCTLCIKACPVDCIVGAAKQMHTVIESLCTGCELCLPACPVDCIHLDVATPGQTGWDAWSAGQAERSRSLYQHRSERIRATDKQEQQRLMSQAAAATRVEVDGGPGNRQQAIAAALARARSRQGS